MVRITAIFIFVCFLSGPTWLQAQGKTTPQATQPVGVTSSALGSDPDHVLPQNNEIKHGLVPSKNDVEMREKLQSLSHLSDEQLTAELHKWPRYQKMSFGERGKFLQRIQDLRDHRKTVAINRAKELNLKLNSEQQAAFEKSFWDKKLESEKELWKEIEPRRKALDEQINQQLLKEFAGEIGKKNN